MRYLHIFFIVIILFVSCKTNQRKKKLKTGTWISQTITKTDTFDYIEKYKKGIEVKKWKTFKNKKIYKTEKYFKGYFVVTFYHPNGKTESKGKTKEDFTNNLSHWYYVGIWNYYDAAGKLIKSKEFKNERP